MSVAGQSDRSRLPLVMAGLAVIGLAIAVYLTTVHFAQGEVYCLGVSGCDEVNKSPYSEVAGLPVSLLGSLLYAALIGVLWAEASERLKPGEARPLLFGMALSGVLYYAYLTYVEVAILRAICIWCVASAVITAAIFVLASVRLRWQFVALAQG